MKPGTDLAEISSWLHDQWFDLNALVRVPDRGEVRIPFFSGSSRKRLIGWTSSPPTADEHPIGWLVVRRVRGFTVDDEAGIRIHSLHHITFDPAGRSLEFESNFPLTLRIDVDALDIEMIDP